MRLTRMIVSQLLRHPFRDILKDDQRTWKAWQLYMGALHLARIIERTTDRPHIGFMLPTSGMAPMSILATWLLGRTSVPINYLLGESEREYLIKDAEVDTVITVRAMIENFGPLPEGVTPIFLEDLKAQAGPIPPLRRAAKRDDDHLAVLLYTSGTSGRPKGVMLTAGNLMSNIEQAETLVGFRQNQHKLFGVIPQFHSFGLTVLTLLPLALGVPVVFTARFMPRRILELLAKEKPSVLVLIPSMYNALLSQKSAKREQFESLRLIVSGGEPLPHAVAEGYRERFGITINEGYGLTETSPATNICMPGAYKPGSVGPALDRLETRIIGDQGQVMATGEEGEIRFRGPNVMKGYYKLPDETAAVFDDDGFFRTGDMGKLDEDGFLYITGRIKEMLIVGGENVFPREIEEVLNAHPSVHASAVIGMQDDVRGELPLAFVELEEDATFDEKALRTICRETLAPYKVPRDIRWIRELPRNPTGKVLRRDLSVDVACLSKSEAAPAANVETDS
ncbi:MAG: class I adenylate-forming enzyme family protein [Phycisphaerales bacterium]